MHWVTPKTAGRMLQSGNLLVEEEAVSLKTSPVTEKDVEAGYVAASDAEEDEVVYEPTPYTEVIVSHCCFPGNDRQLNDSIKVVHKVLSPENVEQSLQRSTNIFDP